MNKRRVFSPLNTVAVLLACIALQAVGAEVLTTTALHKKGVKPLNDSALRSLIIDKTLVLRNRATGQLYEVTFYKNGKRLLLGLSKNRASQQASNTSRSDLEGQGIAAYRIQDGKLFTRFSGKTFVVQVYNVDGKFLAARLKDGGSVNWEILERSGRPANKKIITVAALQENGILPLNERELRKLIVGRTLIVTNRGTNERYEVSYTPDGTRRIRNISAGKLNFTGFRSFHGGVVTEGSARYKIEHGYIVTVVNGREFRAQVFRDKDKLLVAGGKEGGLVNWEAEVARVKAN